MDEFDTVLNGVIPDYRNINYDRITPNLLIKFSNGFDKIIEASEKAEADLYPSKTSSKTCLYYLKRAYDSFLQRIVGITDLHDIEHVLKKCLELSASKYTLKAGDEDSGKRKVVKSYSVLIDEFKNIAEAKLTIQKDSQSLQKKMQSEFQEYSKKKSEELKKLKSNIKSLRSKIEGKGKSEVSMSKYNKLKENFKILINENEQLNHAALKFKEQVDDLTQKKNRMNFLLFLCMKEGYPVNKLYKEEVKPIDSHRFDLLTPTKLKNSIKQINKNISTKNFGKIENKENKQRNTALNESVDELPENFFDDLDQSEFLNKSQEYATYRSIGLNGSYEAIVEGPAIMPKKPSMIPSLDFDRLDEYNKAVKQAKKEKIREKQMQREDADDLGSLLYSS